MLVPLLERREGLTSSQDFTGYQRYLSHRLKKLRRRENLVSRAGKEYNPPPLAATEQHALVALLLAERCWAASHIAKSALYANYAVVSASGLKKTSLSKLAKAEKYARQYVALSGHSLAAQAYHALIAGELAVDRQRWLVGAQECAKACLGFWALTPQIDAALLNSANEYEPAGLSQLFKLACAKQKIPASRDRLDIARDVLSDASFAPFRELVAKHRTYESPAAVVDRTVQFRHHVAEIQHEQLAAAIGAVRQAVTPALESVLVPKDLAKNKPVEQLDEWSAHLERWETVLQTADNIAAELSEQEDARDHNVDVMRTYARYHVLCRRIQRDAALAAVSDNNAEAARLYALIEQSCEELAELPGINNDDELLEGIQGMRQYFRACRSSTIAHAYPKISRERLALLTYAKQQVANAAAPEDLALPITTEYIKKFARELSCDEATAYAFLYLQREACNRSKVLGSYASNTEYYQAVPENEHLEIADWAGRRLDAVAVKPVFYDIAYNYLQPVETNVEEEMKVDEVEPQPAKRGLFGLF